MSESAPQSEGEEGISETDYGPVLMEGVLVGIYCRQADGEIQSEICTVGMKRQTEGQQETCKRTAEIDSRTAETDRRTAELGVCWIVCERVRHTIERIKRI